MGHGVRGVKKSFLNHFSAPLGVPRLVTDKDDLVSDRPIIICSLELTEQSSLVPVLCPILENTYHQLVENESHPSWKGAAAGTTHLSLSWFYLCSSQVYSSSQWCLTPYPSVGDDLASMARISAFQNSKLS